LKKLFDLTVELKFPYGDNYGWGYRLSRFMKKNYKFICNIFFEKGSITMHMRMDIKTEKEIKMYEKLSNEGRKYWENRYPCGKDGGKYGGWINYRIINKDQLKDIGIFLSIKTNREIEI
jgi:hypothetical protein